MHILIENPDTLEYFKATGAWTKLPLDGKYFPNTRAAVRVARHEPMGRFNVVCFMPKTNQFVNLDHGRGTGTAEGVVAAG